MSHMAPRTGLEPVTHGLEDRCSDSNWANEVYCIIPGCSSHSIYYCCFSPLTCRLGNLTRIKTTSWYWLRSTWYYFLLTTDNSRLRFSRYFQIFHWCSTFVLYLSYNQYLLNYRHLSRLPVVPGQVACLLLSLAIISSLSVKCPSQYLVLRKHR